MKPKFSSAANEIRSLQGRLGLALNVMELVIQKNLVLMEENQHLVKTLAIIQQQLQNKNDLTAEEIQNLLEYCKLAIHGVGVKL